MTPEELARMRWLVEETQKEPRTNHAVTWPELFATTVSRLLDEVERLQAEVTAWKARIQNLLGISPEALLRVANRLAATTPKQGA